MADRDSPWKELAEQDRELLVKFFYPDIHGDLDWSREVESLEQEFRKINPKAATGRRIVDKLFKAHRKGSGDVRYLHLEVQGWPSRRFRRRVYVYNYRAEDHFQQPVASLVLLVDDHPTWRPRGYRAEVYGTKRVLTFRTIKVLDWGGREAELEAHENPVGLFVLAHLEGRRLKKDEEGRSAVKARLIRRLRERGLTGEEMRHWYRYLDWLLPLSDVYDRRLWQDLEQGEKEKPMPFVTFADRYYAEKAREDGLEKGLEKGLGKGLRNAIALGLDLKFQQAGLALMPLVEKVEDVATLQAICDAIKPAAGVEDIRKLLPVPA